VTYLIVTLSTRTTLTKKHTTVQSASTVTATKAKGSFSAVLTRAGYRGERIVIKKGACPTAVILGYDDYQQLVD